MIAVSDSGGGHLRGPARRAGGVGRVPHRACQGRAGPADDPPQLVRTRARQKAPGRIRVRASKRLASAGGGRRRTRPRAARAAKRTVRSARVRLPGPAGGKLADLGVSVVIAREGRPPAGAEPVVRVPFTGLPVGTSAGAQAALDDYACRRGIEVSFGTPADGCRIEALQLERPDRYAAWRAVYLIVAGRVLYLLMRGRTGPGVCCTAVLTAAEGQSVDVRAPGPGLPDRPPALGAMVVMTAKRGGYVGRKADGRPGPKALWIGRQRMRDYAVARTAFASQPAGGNV